MYFTVDRVPHTNGGKNSPTILYMSIFKPNLRMENFYAYMNDGTTLLRIFLSDVRSVCGSNLQRISNTFSQ